MQNNSGANGSRTFFYTVALAGCLLGALLLSNQLVAKSPVTLPGPDPTVITPAAAQQIGGLKDTSPAPYLNLVSNSPAIVGRSLAAIRKNWHPGSPVMMLEAARFSRSRTTLASVIALLEMQTGQRLGGDFDAWLQWIWKQESQPHPRYAEFKSKLYSSIDPRFAEYFADAKNPKIRLDEIRWGGVIRDGIPPLKDPEMLAATQATYLSDSDVVFGIDLNGDARCYPKRILAWHEMFKDTLGGESICGVY